MRDKRFRSTRWHGKGRSPGPGSTINPIYAPRSNDSVPGGIQHPPGNAFPTGNAHPTHRCGGDSRSWPNEIANWTPRIGNYARRSRSPSANSAPHRSSAAQATRRERNRSQSSDPVDDHVGDTDHDVSEQVNATGNHRAEDNVRAVRRQLRLAGLCGDRAQPAARRRDARRRRARRRARCHPAPPPGHRARPLRRTGTPADAAPARALAVADRVENPVGQHHRLQSGDPTSRMNATSPAHPPSQARPRRHVESWCRPADHSCPHHFPTAPIVQKSAPRRHDITDPRIQAKRVNQYRYSKKNSASQLNCRSKTSRSTNWPLTRPYLHRTALDGSRRT